MAYRRNPRWYTWTFMVGVPVAIGGGAWWWMTRGRKQKILAALQGVDATITVGDIGGPIPADIMEVVRKDLGEAGEVGITEGWIISDAAWELLGIQDLETSLVSLRAHKMVSLDMPEGQAREWSPWAFLLRAKDVDHVRELMRMRAEAPEFDPRIPAQTGTSGYG